MQAVESSRILPVPGQVISMVLWTDSLDMLWGAIRNAQLRNIYFPQWTLRVYVAHNFTNITSNKSSKDEPSQKTTMLDVRSTLETLKTLDVDIRYVDKSKLTPEVPQSLLNLLAVDDPDVTYVLLRRADMRLSEREAAAISSWKDSSNGKKATHCMRDHPRHVDTALVPGLWAINTHAVKKILHGQSMHNLLKNFTVKHNHKLNNAIESIFYEHMWTLFKSNTMCHDSVSCTKWPNSMSFPMKRPKKEFVGKLYTPFEPIATDLTPLFSTHAKCLTT